METLNILYVGDNKNSTILSALDPQTMTPQTAQEALAMYVLYFPDVIILEGRSEMVSEVFYHLSSGVTQTAPLGVEAILVIDDEAGWKTPPNTIMKRLPANASPDEVLEAIEALVAEREASYEAAYVLEMEAERVA